MQLLGAMGLILFCLVIEKAAISGSVLGETGEGSACERSFGSRCGQGCLEKFAGPE